MLIITNYPKMHFRTITKFFRKHNRMPNPNEPGGKFIEAARSGKYLMYHKRLDKLSPTWTDNGVVVLPGALQKTIDFYTGYGRVPKVHEEGGVALRNARHGQYKNWHETLDKLMPGWRIITYHGPTIEPGFKRLVAFYKQKGRFPFSGERSYELLNKLRKGSYPDYESRLSAVCPTWRESGSSATFDDSLRLINDRLTTYIDKSRAAAIESAVIVNKTVKLSNGFEWTGPVRQYPVLGQGCDFD